MESTDMSYRRPLAVALITLVGLVLVPIVRPSTLLEAVRFAEHSRAGLTQYTVRIDDHDITYLRGGDGPTVLLVHGFSADKDNWTWMSRYLTADYDVIAIDLAGHGESSRLPNASYDIRSQVERLEAFRAHLDVDRMHLAGNSMGGHISAAYAIAYPCLLYTSPSPRDRG